MKKYLLILGLLGVGGLALGYFLWNKPHKNIGASTAAFSLEAAALLTEFEADESAANTKYNDQVLQVSGNVADVSKDAAGLVKVTLDTGNPLSGIICELNQETDHARLDFQTGEPVVFKGVCTGMLSDVILIRCVEVKN